MARSISPGSSAGCVVGEEVGERHAPRAQERRRQGATGQRGPLSGRHGPLAPLLHERPDELLGVLLEHLVDLVEDGIDVFAQGLVTLADVAALDRSVLDLVGPTIGVLLTAALLCTHEPHLSLEPDPSRIDAPGRALNPGRERQSGAVSEPLDDGRFRGEGWLRGGECVDQLGGGVAPVEQARPRGAWCPSAARASAPAAATPARERRRSPSPTMRPPRGCRTDGRTRPGTRLWCREAARGRLARWSFRR